MSGRVVVVVVVVKLRALAVTGGSGGAHDCRKIAGRLIISSVSISDETGPDNKRTRDGPGRRVCMRLTVLARGPAAQRRRPVHVVMSSPVVRLHSHNGRSTFLRPGHFIMSVKQFLV